MSTAETGMETGAYARERMASRVRHEIMEEFNRCRRAETPRAAANAALEVIERLREGRLDDRIRAALAPTED